MDGSKSSIISIHALLAESDVILSLMGNLLLYFYPRSPCGERPGKVRVVEPGLLFLSTLSLRRATNYVVTRGNDYVFLSTLSLRRATYIYRQFDARGFQFLSTLSLRRATLRLTSCSLRYWSNFYPRSPCGERHDGLIASANFCKFLSTLSLRRATLQRLPYGANSCISIHALLAESDFPAP